MTKLFTEEDIKNSFHEIWAMEDIDIQLTYRGQDDFINTCYEKNILITTTDKLQFGSLLEFWIKSLKKAYASFEDYEPHLNDFMGSCEPTQLKTFEKEQDNWNNPQTGLKEPIILSLTLEDEIYHIINKWSDQAFIIESNTQYICIYWWTTA